MVIHEGRLQRMTYIRPWPTFNPDFPVILICLHLNLPHLSSRHSDVTHFKRVVRLSRLFYPFWSCRAYYVGRWGTLMLRCLVKELYLDPVAVHRLCAVWLKLVLRQRLYWINSLPNLDVNTHFGHSPSIWLTLPPILFVDVLNGWPLNFCAFFLF